MTSIQPYRAWLFYGADDRSEVDEDYAAIQRGDLPYSDALIEDVTVMAADIDHAIPRVWFVDSKGMLDTRPSWMVRRDLYSGSLVPA